MICPFEPYGCDDHQPDGCRYLVSDEEFEHVMRILTTPANPTPALRQLLRDNPDTAGAGIAEGGEGVKPPTTYQEDALRMENLADIPASVWRGEFTILGVTLRCHVLSDGRRIIDAEDVERLFAAMGDVNLDDDVPPDVEKFARWLQGAHSPRTEERG